MSWQPRKDYLLLTTEEETALRTLQPLMARHVEDLVGAFYRHLLQFPDTRRLLSDELIATRLKDAQKRYLISLVTGPYDERYRDDRLRIGQVHDRIGLTPQWYLGAYALYLNLLTTLIQKEYRSKPAQGEFLRAALTKVVFLDIQLAIEAYIQKGSEKLELANRQLAELSRDLEKGLSQKKKDLEKERDFIASVLETSGALVIVLDADGRIVKFNRACEVISGYSFEEVRQRHVWDLLLPPEDIESVKGVFREITAGRVLTNYQNHWVTKRGERRLIAWNATYVADGKGAVEYVLGAGIDITELKRTEKQLLETAEQFRLTVEASPSGMLMVDERGSILLVNAQIETQFGYSREELLGQPVEILLPGALREKHRRQRTDFFAHPEPRQMGKGRDLFGLRKDGKEIPVEIGLNPIRTAEGPRVLASVVDITERKNIEEQLRRTERVAELGTLASGMAHEIGTPMNVILGRAEFLMRKTEDDTIKKGLGTIVTQVERITKIMNQLLTFARRRPSELGPLELRKTIEDSLEILQERLRKHRVQVETDFRRQVPNVHADADQMSQVLLNLFINAVHAMPEGGTLRVGLTEAGGQAVLTITDTGCGISKEDLSKIFAPFFTTKEVGKGTGLGLTVVQGIIQEHRGTITVNSEPGKGTTFTITLPLYEKP